MLDFVSTLLIVLCFAIACLSFVFTLKNKHVRLLLKEGWSPLLGAMVISSGTGIVLDIFVSRYKGFALLQSCNSYQWYVSNNLKDLLPKMLHRPSRSCRFYSRLRIIYVFTCNCSSSQPRSSFLFKSIEIPKTMSTSCHAYTSRRNHPRSDHIPHDPRHFRLV